MKGGKGKRVKAILVRDPKRKSAGGLRGKDITTNKQGKYVSAKASTTAKERAKQPGTSQANIALWARMLKASPRVDPLSSSQSETSK